MSVHRLKCDDDDEEEKQMENTLEKNKRGRKLNDTIYLISSVKNDREIPVRIIMMIVHPFRLASI